jgi:hypothetical protein
VEAISRKRGRGRAVLKTTTPSLPTEGGGKSLGLLASAPRGSPGRTKRTLNTQGRPVMTRLSHWLPFSAAAAVAVACSTGRHDRPGPEDGPTQGLGTACGGPGAGGLPD